jgi:hypothetical protein
MKMLQTIVLLALLSSNSRAGDGCGAGYEKQFMDEDSIGYCTRIPSLQEQADRAEAFAKHGLLRMHYVCVMMNHTTGRDREKLVSDFAIVSSKVAMMQLAPFAGISMDNVEGFNRIANSPDGKRITAALDIAQKQIVNCKDEK